MDKLNIVLQTMRDAVWGVPTLVLLLGTGLYFTIRLRGLQFRKFPLACKMIFEKEDGGGDVSPFGSLCTSLAATIGTGSIVGVATALRMEVPRRAVLDVGIRAPRHGNKVCGITACRKIPHDRRKGRILRRTAVLYTERHGEKVDSACKDLCRVRTDNRASRKRNLSAG